MLSTDIAGKHPGRPPLGTANLDGTVVETVISRVGHLTRILHDNLRELGYSTLLERAASAIPDAQDRLAYVAVMTEQAAERSLNATEIAKPIQDELAVQARSLSTQWRDVWDDKKEGEIDAESLLSLIAQTRSYLDVVPERTDATNAQLLEIMMAQDFQDLTGQVIKKLMTMIRGIEQELVQLLLDHVPAEKKGENDNGLMNGPVVKSEGRDDVVTNQNQVDDLLASLGF
jgi:chemotaxis protein CheZ